MKKGIVNFDKINSHVKKLFNSDKKVKLIAVVCVIGIVLILVSDYLPKAESKEKPKANSVCNDELVQTAKAMEQEISEIVSSIEGVGRNKVLVTLEKGMQYEYVKEKKSDKDYSEETGENGDVKLETKDSVEEKYIYIDGAEGKKALISVRQAPTVKGVVVVCEGGDNKLVQSRVINAVTTAFGISSARVCVTKISENI